MGQVSNELHRAENERPRRRARLTLWDVLKYAALTVAGVLLFIAGSSYAYEQRGYIAVGGEVFALFLPVLYYALSATIRDTIRTLKAARNGDLPKWGDE